MIQVRSRAAAARPSLAPIAWSATALLSLVLVLAAAPGRAAVKAGDADTIGQRTPDKSAPART